MCLKEGTKIELQRDISQIGLQDVYCRLFAVILQVVNRLFAVRDPYIDFSSDHMPFPNNFRGLKKKTRYRRTSGLTDRQTKRRVYKQLK